MESVPKNKCAEERALLSSDTVRIKPSPMSTVVPAQVNQPPAKPSLLSSAGDTTPLNQWISEESLSAPSAHSASSPLAAESSKSSGSIKEPCPTEFERPAHNITTNSSIIFKETCGSASPNSSCHSPPYRTISPDPPASQGALRPITTANTTFNELKLPGFNPPTCSSCTLRGESGRTCCILESSNMMKERTGWVDDDDADDALPTEKPKPFYARVPMSLTTLFPKKESQQLPTKRALKPNSRPWMMRRRAVPPTIVKEPAKSEMMQPTISLFPTIPSRMQSSEPVEYTANGSSYIGNSYQPPPTEDLSAHFNLFNGQPLPLHITPPRPNSISAISARGWGWVGKRTAAILPEINTSISELKMPSDSVLELSPLLSELIKRKILYEKACADGSHNEALQRLARNKPPVSKVKYVLKRTFPIRRNFSAADYEAEVSEANRNKEVKKIIGAKKEMERSARETIHQFYSSKRPYQRPHMDAVMIRSRFEEAGSGEATSSSHPDLGVKLQIPEAIIETSDLEWREDGSLAITGTAARELMANAVLWIPSSDDVVEEHDLFSKLPTTEHILESEGTSVDIMRTHLAHGRWTWIMEPLTAMTRMQINVEKTAELDDARFFVLKNPKVTNPLMVFTHRGHFTYRGIPRNLMAARIRSRLQVMILESSHAALDEHSRFKGNVIVRPRDPNLVWKIGLFAGPNVRLAKAIRIARANLDGLPTPATPGQKRVWTTIQERIPYLQGRRLEKQTKELDPWDILELTEPARRKAQLDKIAKEREQMAVESNAQVEAEGRMWTNGRPNMPGLKSPAPYADPCPGRKGKGLAELYPWPEQWPEDSTEPTSEDAVEVEIKEPPNCAAEVPNASQRSSSTSLFQRFWTLKRESLSSDSSASPHVSVKSEQPKARGETRYFKAMPFTWLVAPAKSGSVESPVSAALPSIQKTNAKRRNRLTLLNRRIRLSKPPPTAPNPSISSYPTTEATPTSELTPELLRLPASLLASLFPDPNAGKG